MKLLLMAVALSTCSLVAACETTRVVEAVQPDADKMDCRVLDGRPAIPAEYVINWSAVTSVPQARSEHEAYVRSVRTREGIVAGHIVQIEDRLFMCSSDAEWMRDFFRRLPDS